MPLAGAVPPVGAWHSCVQLVSCAGSSDQQRELQSSWTPSCCGAAGFKSGFVQLPRNLKSSCCTTKMLHSPVKCGGGPVPQPGLKLFLVTFMTVRLERTSQTKRSFSEEDL